MNIASVSSSFVPQLNASKAAPRTMQQRAVSAYSSNQVQTTFSGASMLDRLLFQVFMLLGGKLPTEPLDTTNWTELFDPTLELPNLPITSGLRSGTEQQDIGGYLFISKGDKSGLIDPTMPPITSAISREANKIFYKFPSKNSIQQRPVRETPLTEILEGIEANPFQGIKQNFQLVNTEAFTSWYDQLTQQKKEQIIEALKIAPPKTPLNTIAIFIGGDPLLNRPELFTAVIENNHLNWGINAASPFFQLMKKYRACHKNQNVCVVTTEDPFVAAEKYPCVRESQMRFLLTQPDIMVKPEALAKLKARMGDNISESIQTMIEEYSNRFTAS